jgi:hypothetical protein
MFADAKICGGGSACEQVCPFMKIGRDCPTFDEVAEACETLGLNPWGVLSQRVPELA